MKNYAFFNVKRWYLLTRNVVFLNRASLLIMAGAIGGLALFVSGINAFQGAAPNIHFKLYFFLLFFGGFFVTGRIFKELHHKERGSAYLLLPASVLEKFTSRLFLSTIGYVAGTMVFWFLFSAISEGINWMLFKQTNTLFNPFDWRIMRGVAFYLVVQAPFLVSAVYFKRLNISKTILVGVGFAFVWMVVAVVAGKLIFWGYFDGFIPSFGFLTQITAVVRGHEMQLLKLARFIWWAWRLLFWTGIAPLCWIIGYYRLKETEV